MNMYINYSGSFLSVAGTHWTVDILSEHPGEVKDLEFDSDPLTIEWAEESKEVPICGSTATLRVISPGDRSFFDLYAEKPLAIKMVVYRDHTTYWEGYLDTEFYEEPYAYAKGYTVTLTFSDFGVLDRLKYTGGTGKKSLIKIIRFALTELGLYPDPDMSMISGDAEGTQLLALEVEGSNFYDEDGEALTLKEVLEGILQPLALRMIQRAGMVWIYDLNGLALSGNRLAISWQDTNQTLGTDKVYNNAKVTWSPYVAKEFNLSEECWTQPIEFTEEQARDALNSGPVDIGGGTKLHSYHYTPSRDRWEDRTDLGFVMLVNSSGQGASFENIIGFYESIGFFNIVPVGDGTEASGVALTWPYVTDVVLDSIIMWKTGTTLSIGPDGTPGSTKVRFDSVYIPPAPPYRLGELKLRVCLDALMDSRYNPFETPVDDGIVPSDKSTFDRMKDHANFMYVPVKIKFRPNDSEDVYVWSNREALISGEPITDLYSTQGAWHSDSGSVFGYLCWYDPKDRAGNTGVTGWRRNKPAINPHTEALNSALENASDGQILPWPFGAEVGGELWVEVLEGPWITKDHDTGGITTMTTLEQSIANAISWRLFKTPEITAEKKYSTDRELPDEDVEYSGVLNANASESIEIDTICGTSDEPVFLARGAYMHPDGEYVRKITRGGITGQAEDVLIGTLYSQFGSRKLKLSGTAAMNGEGVCLYTDEASEGVNLMLVGAVENIREDTMEGTFVEVSPDEYTGTHI